jgi:hypothetical protein
MTTATVARLRADVAGLRTLVTPPTAPPGALEVARLAGLSPDPWQRDLLGSTARQEILLCSRQSGKSTAVAILATHAATAHPGSLVLVLAPALRQSQELFRKIRDVHAALGAAAPADVENRLSLELANGSRIVTLPGKEATIRGFSGVSLLIVDEASRVDDALYQAVRPMLAVSGGRIVLLSTPFGKRGFFYTEWTDGGPAWRRTKITAHDCPRIDPAWLEAERAAIGDWWFNQEYLCAFVETTDAAFRFDDIQAAFATDATPLWGNDHAA